MASLSKLIGTTMAALRLIENGKLSLFNTVGDYFDQCYGKENITIRDLMTHTSGIPAHIPLYLRNIQPETAAQQTSFYKKLWPIQPAAKLYIAAWDIFFLERYWKKLNQKALTALSTRFVLEPLSMGQSGYCPPKRHAVCFNRMGSCIRHLSQRYGPR